MMSVIYTWLSLGFVSWSLLMLGCIARRRTLVWQDYALHVFIVLPLALLTGPLTFARFLL